MKLVLNLQFLLIFEHHIESTSQYKWNCLVWFLSTYYTVHYRNVDTMVTHRKQCAEYLESWIWKKKIIHVIHSSYQAHELIISYWKIKLWIFYDCATNSFASVWRSIGRVILIFKQSLGLTLIFIIELYALNKSKCFQTPPKIGLGNPGTLIQKILIIQVNCKKMNH